jgi:HEAT repeat protein
MKRTSLFLYASILGVPAAAAVPAPTAATVELHSSTSSVSPASDIKVSTTAAAAAQEAGREKLAGLTLGLKAPDPHARMRAASGLGALGSAAAMNLPVLTDLLGDRTAGIEAARAIHKIDPTYTIPPAALARLLKRAKAAPERERVRTGWITRCESQAQALDTLAALGSAAHSTIPELVKLSHRSCVHESVTAALTQIGEPDRAQLTQIAAGLVDKDPEARQAAIEYIVKAQPGAEAIPTLGKAMNDSNSGVRLSALQALEEIHPEGEGRLPLLAGFLKDPSPEIRERALYMIGQLGAEAKMAVPLLHEALKDSEPSIALAGAKFLAKIDPQDNILITTLIGFTKQTGSAPGMQAAQLLESLNVHEARVDTALEPYRTQQALWHRINKAISDTPPERLAENARTLKIQNLRVASGIIQDQPVHIAKIFPAGIGRVYCWTEVSISTPPASITHRWYRNGKLQHEEELEVTSTQTRLWSSSAVRSGGWKVDVIPSGTNEPLATAVFTVAKPK